MRRLPAPRLSAHGLAQDAVSVDARGENESTGLLYAARRGQVDMACGAVSCARI